MPGRLRVGRHWVGCGQRYILKVESVERDVELKCHMVLSQTRYPCSFDTSRVRCPVCVHRCLRKPVNGCRRERVNEKRTIMGSVSDWVAESFGNSCPSGSVLGIGVDGPATRLV